MGNKLLDLPDELHNIIGKYSSTESLKVLSEVDTRFHRLYQPQLDLRRAVAAKELMGYVLLPTPENLAKAKAKAMYKADPQILFIKTEGYEPASGIEEYVDEAGQTQTRAVPRS